MHGHSHFEIKFILQKVGLFDLMSLYFWMTVFMQIFNQLKLEIFQFFFYYYLSLPFHVVGSLVLSNNNNIPSPGPVTY